MNAENTGYDSDLAFCLDLFKVEIANSSFLYNFFEEESIFWIDDIDLSCSMVLKTLKMQEPNSEFELLPLYKKDDDEEEFIRLLLQKTIAMDKENEQLIDEGYAWGYMGETKVKDFDALLAKRKTYSSKN